MSERASEFFLISSFSITAAGQEVLKVLEMDEESGFRVCEGQGDAAEAASRVRAMLHALHLLTTAVEACWRRLNTALDTYMQVSKQTLSFTFSLLDNWIKYEIVTLD